MTLAEYRLEIYSLMQRIKMTAEMINSYMSKFHELGILEASSSSVANAAIELAKKFYEADQADPTFWYDEERVKTSTLKIGIDPFNIWSGNLKHYNKFLCSCRKLMLVAFEIGNPNANDSRRF